MGLYIANGKEIRGDLIVMMTLRSDLAPVPKTLEATLRFDEDLAPWLSEGKVLMSGLDGSEYRIVKSVPNLDSSGGQQAGRLLASTTVSCYLEKACNIGFRRSAAIIKENTSLAQIYTAAGAKLRVENDVKISRFSCFVGQVPSFGVAQLLQEEGGAIYWTGKALKFSRLADLERQKPVVEVGVEMVETIQSGFLERHQVPWFFSIDASGGFVSGNRERARAALYSPRKDVRALRNATRCLILRHKLTSLYRPDVNAGAAIKVGPNVCPIITASHVYKSGTDGSEAASYSKFWLGSVDE